MEDLGISQDYVIIDVKKTYICWYPQPPTNQQWVKVAIYQLFVICPLVNLLMGSPAQTNPQSSSHIRKQGCNKICEKEIFIKLFDLFKLKIHRSP